MIEVEKKFEQILINYFEIGKEAGGMDILFDIQKIFGYIPEKSYFWFSERTGIPAAHLYGLVSFYPRFRLKPSGENIITFCLGTACHMQGAKKLYDDVRSELKINKGEDTTNDGKFTVDKIYCRGICSIAPIVEINKKLHGKMTWGKMKENMKKIN